MTVQRVEYPPAGPVMSAPVGKKRLWGPRLRGALFPRTPPRRENGLTYLRAIGPDPDLRTHQSGERTAAPESASAGAGQRDLRKELRFGHADFAVGRNHDLFGFANIGPALDER